MRRLSLVAPAMVLTVLLSNSCWGQLAGSRAGAPGDSGAGGSVASLPLLEREVVEGFIAIDGRAELRLRPTELRIVLAVASEGETAQECQTAISETIRKLKGSWKQAGIAEKQIVEDFIAVLPLYEWTLEKRGQKEMGVEKKSGYRMQVNVHLAVSNDATAQRALAHAFEHGVTDIIAFDYWSKEVDAAKTKARQQAVKAARGKADTLLNALFDVPPPVINVQERTTVRFPDSLYHSFVNSYDEEVSGPWRRDVPFIRAHRPRNTYYRGLFSDGDVHPPELPMTPEISVVSDVRLYFKAGGQGQRQAD